MASKSGLGSCTLWGLTPALNLLNFLDDKTLIEADDNEKAINILLFGQCDCRHVLRTLEEHLNFRTTVSGKKIKINIYIVESNIELYARQLLFLTLAMTPPDKIGLYEKTRQYMELYGNTYLRPRTQATLIKISEHLVKMITDDDYMAQKLPFVSISNLKFRERDALVELCKYWHDYCDSRREDLVEKWDRRLRYHLGTRYDSRVRIFDWDYHMRLQEQDAKIVSAEEYKNWRGTGLAFVDLDSDYSQPNATLISGAYSSSNIKNAAFLGEIVTGPFISFGIECDDKSMFEKANDRFKHNSGDVTQHNLEKTLETISKAKIKKEDGFEGYNTNTGNSGGSGDVAGSREKIYLSEIFSVNFLPMESARFLHLKSMFEKKFQLVYFSSTMAQNLTPDTAKVFAPEAIIIVEGVRYTLELRKEHVKAYEDKVKELAEKVNLFRCPEDSEAFHEDYLAFTTVDPHTDDESSEEAEVTKDKTAEKSKKKKKAVNKGCDENEEEEIIEIKSSTQKTKNKKGKSKTNVDSGDQKETLEDNNEVKDKEKAQHDYNSDSDSHIVVSDSSDCFSSREPSISNIDSLLNKISKEE